LSPERVVSIKRKPGDSTQAHAWNTLNVITVRLLLAVACVGGVGRMLRFTPRTMAEAKKIIAISSMTTGIPTSAISLFRTDGAHAPLTAAGCMRALGSSRRRKKSLYDRLHGGGACERWSRTQTTTRRDALSGRRHEAQVEQQKRNAKQQHHGPHGARYVAQEQPTNAGDVSTGQSAKVRKQPEDDHEHLCSGT
jgi:hypothetical protein